MSTTPSEKQPALSVIQLSTCGCGDTSERIAEGADPRAVVREKYGAVAQGQGGVAGCCATALDADAVTAQLGYSPEQLATLPAGANLGLGCGNPLAFAALKPGMTVLDLGSGAGIDCFLAAREVGPTGHVIGVDMTPAMIERARANAAKAALPHVEFRLGEIEHLPVADSTVDVIISNCVVNLSPDKPQVFREALRALKPGGQLMVSDLVLLEPLTAELQQSVALYVGCVGGASLRADYLRLMREAGFAQVEVLAESGYAVGSDLLPEGSPERRAFEVVSSVKVRAIKP